MDMYSAIKIVLNVFDVLYFKYNVMYNILLYCVIHLDVTTYDVIVIVH